MMKKRELAILVVVPFVIYFISDYFFNDVMLYVTGGAMLGGLNILFERIGLNSNIKVLFFIWALLVAAIVFLYYRLQSKILKYTALAMIAIQLYVVDFILLEITKFQIVNSRTYYISIAMRVISKGMVLAGIIYFKRKQELRKEAG